MPISHARIRELLKLLPPEFTLEQFIETTKLSQGTARKYLNELIKRGYVNKKNGGYALTEKAQLLLEGLTTSARVVDFDKSYIFTDEHGNYIPLRIDSLKKLYVVVKYGLLPENIIRLHIEKGYLSSWLTSQFGANLLARKLSEAKSIEEIVSILEEYLSQ